MRHPTLILRAAVRTPAGRLAIPPQDVTPAAAAWVGVGAPARVDPMDLLPHLDRGAREAAVRGKLDLESPLAAFPAFASRVEAEGGPEALLDHISDIRVSARLARRARSVLRDAARATHRPAAPSEPLFEPLAECYYAGLTDFRADWREDRDDGPPPPFAFGTRLARWPGLTLEEVGDWISSEGAADITRILEASLDGFHPGAMEALSGVDGLARAIADWERGRTGAAETGSALRRWNAGQRVVSRVADRTTALWTADGATRASVLAWCRANDAMFAEAERGVAATWPRRRA